MHCPRRRPLEPPGSAASSRAACPALQRVGPSASLLSLQTIGLGSPAGPDAAVSFVSSGLAGRPGPQLAEGMVGQLSL